jgi:arylsulfatase A-like enzyme
MKHPPPPAAPTAPPEPGRWVSLLGSACAAASCGIGAGLIAALLDTRQAWSEVDGASAVALVLLHTASRLAVAGAALSLVVWIFASLGAAIAGRLGRRVVGGGAVGTALLFAPGLVYVSLRLFQGGFTSQLPARPLLIGATAAILIVLFWIGARLWLRLVRAADERPKIGRLLVVAALLLALAGLGLRWSDAHLYRRLYLYLHGALAVGTLGGLALALRLTLLRRPLSASRFPRIVRAGAIALAVALLLLAGARMLMDQRQVVKLAVYERTATTAAVLRVTSGPREVGAGPRPSAEARRARYERERRAQASLAGGFPAFPGAHLVLISVDALRADRLGAYGHRRRDLTPRIDEWSSRAALFERVYCPAPHSSYSISSMHTSRYLHDEALLGRDIAYPTLAKILSERGYETSALYTQGIFFTEGDKVGHYKQIRFGFEDANHGAPRPGQLTDYAIAELDRFVARGEPPIFLWVHYFNIHEPYLSTRFGAAPADRYEGEIAETDPEIERLLRYIDEKLARDTIVVLTADHGEEFEDHGGHYHGSSLYDEQVRVPLIIDVPGAPPQRIKSQVSTIDLAPTLLQLLGVDQGGEMVGQDLRPAIFGGEAAHVARPVFSSVVRKHMVVRWPWKLIADPSRDLYELFQLEDDRAEKVNRYDGQRELADELLGEIYAWLDELGRDDDLARTALNLGRMRDPRAVPELLAVAVNTGAPTADRVEALDLLGAIRDYDRTAEIIRLLDDTDEAVSTAAALALGELGNPQGQDLLRDALYDDDPSIRDRAARALGELGDRAAVPVLIEALGRDDLKVREHAIRLLGRLGDPRATEALIEILAEDRTRYLAVLALGKIGDRRAYEPLLEVLEHERHTDIRGYTVVALGWMELPEAIPRVLRVLEEEPELRWTPEALVRLEAVGRAPLYGSDIAEGAPAMKSGWGSCLTKEKILHQEYLGRTTCKSSGRVATLELDAAAPHGAEVIVRARHLFPDKGLEAELKIAVDGRPVGVVKLSGKMEQLRIETSGEHWRAGRKRVRLELDPPGRFEVDHLLVLAHRK